MNEELKQRIIAALEWLTISAKMRADDVRENLEPGSQGGYSPELTDALAVLDEVKRDIDV